MKKALITGITGQDGAYLAKLLLDKGYKVYGLIRRSSSMRNRIHIDALNINLMYGDLTDSASIDNIIKEIMPDEIYNLAAQSHVGISFKVPESTFDINALGVLRILEAVKRYCPKAKIYQASTSEMYGKSQEMSDEGTTFTANSPYAVAKLAAHNLCEIYRDAYGMFICCGILFNHESPYRGDNFVTKKITKSIAQIKRGKRSAFALGNLDSVRDWGYAGDYVEAMWLMLQQDKPDDFVIATGETHTVREFVEEACDSLNMVVSWIGKGTDTIGTISDFQGKVKGHVTVSKLYYRPKEVNFLKGNASKARKILGWYPKTKFKELVKIMTEFDYAYE